MWSESVPKDFEKTTEILPFNQFGLSPMGEYQKAEEEDRREWLKGNGLTSQEIKLYEENEANFLEFLQKSRQDAEPGVLKHKLDVMYDKMNTMHNKKKRDSTHHQDVQPSTSSASTPENLIERLQQNPDTFYSQGHPMNELKELEGHVFGHIKPDMAPLLKKRKHLQGMQRQKDRLVEANPFNIDTILSTSRVDRPKTFWDTREMPRFIPHTITSRDQEENMPHFQSMYTVRNNKIMRLEPVLADEEEINARVNPIIESESHLLEGTKMCIDDIRKIDRFKDYEPGIPSKVLFLKNIAPRVSQEQLLVLFNQFVLANGGPVDLRLMTGHMRGKALVIFRCLETAIQALEEINGTILAGRPVIAMFDRNTNRI